MKLKGEEATIKAYYEHVSEEGARWNNELWIHHRSRARRTTTNR